MPSESSTHSVPVPPDPLLPDEFVCQGPSVGEFLPSGSQLSGDALLGFVEDLKKNHHEVKANDNIYELVECGIAHGSVWIKFRKVKDG